MVTPVEKKLLRSYGFDDKVIKVYDWIKNISHLSWFARGNGKTKTLMIKGLVDLGADCIAKIECKKYRSNGECVTGGLCVCNQKCHKRMIYMCRAIDDLVKAFNGDVEE